MSAPVDVLAVMLDVQGPLVWQLERAIEAHEADCKAGYPAALIDCSAERRRAAAERCENAIKARAAVAELVLAAKALAERVEFEGDEHRYDYQYLPLRAALAKFGGAT